MKTYVIGHLKPDTDSVVAALALAEFYRHTPSFNRPNAEAVIAEPINNETAFLLNKFAVLVPKSLPPKIFSQKIKLFWLITMKPINDL